MADPTLRIFATLAWGFEPSLWGAFGFSNETVRNRLAMELRKGNACVLSMGTMGPETPEPMQGRLLALQSLGSGAIRTDELVEPALWQRHLDDNNGVPKWPYGLPIISAERFVSPLPLRADILPRLHEQNLHQKLATNYEELTPEEVARVLALRREPVSDIWKSAAVPFQVGLKRTPPGPPPSLTTRTLVPTSGPASTYCFELGGSALDKVAAGITHPRSGMKIFKVGFSNDHVRRLSQLNAYLPDKETLSWRHNIVQWHNDEINAWAMEQEVFRQLLRKGARQVKGEIYSTTEDILQAAWFAALSGARRPDGPVVVEVEETFVAAPETALSELP